MVSNISNLKVKLFYIASMVSLIGISIDFIFVELNQSVIYLNALTILFTVIVIVLFYFKKLSSNFSNALIIYSVFLNALLSILIKIQLFNIDANYFQSSLLFGILILYSGFALRRGHIFILGFTQIIFYLGITFYSESPILLNFMPTTLILITSYLFGMNYIIRILNEYHMEQSVYISNMHEVNLLLEEKGVELKNLNVTKDKLFSILGHDLRTPSNSIMGFADLIARKSEAIESETIKNYCNHIYQSSNSLNLLIGDLIDWAQLQTGKAVTIIQMVNINDIIKDPIELMHGTIFLKNINVLFPDESTVEIEADKQMLATVIRNLLNNALKYTPKKGNISIESRIENDQYLFSIKDSGMGMDELTLAGLFNDITVDSMPGTEFETGTGMGLVICWGYIKLHDGKIWAESEVGLGSTFSFSIPLSSVFRKN